MMNFHIFFIFIMYNKANQIGKGVFNMAKKQLIDLVNRLKGSGIKVSFSKPRPKTILLLQQQAKLSSTTN